MRVADGVVGDAVVSGDGVGVATCSVGTGVNVAWDVGCGGGFVGCGGGFVAGGRGVGVSVPDGIVWSRPVLCPGAAHRWGPVAVAAISIPKRMIQNPYFLLPTALLLPLLMVVSSSEG